MDKEVQERIQRLGFSGIFRESFTITLSRRKLFSQITIATIFPLSLIFFGHEQLCEFLFADIIHNKEFLHRPSKYDSISDTLLAEKITFWLVKIVYFVFFLAISLMSTSAVVYTVACIYTTKDITFVEVMSVVTKVWKRLMVTLIWNFIFVLVYNIAALSILFPWLRSIGGPNVAGVVVVGPLFIIYMLGFVCISIIWHLASVVSVMEEECGIEAMIRGMALVKGKMVISFPIFLLINSCFILIQMAFQMFVVFGETVCSRIGYGIVCFLMLSGFTLLGLTVQTLVYFVCKLHHHEILTSPGGSEQGQSRPGLSLVPDPDPDLYHWKPFSSPSRAPMPALRLEMTLGDYALLRSEDVQIEQF